MTTDESNREYLVRAAKVIKSLGKDIETIGDITELLVRTLKSGRTLLTCGNGGSAAEAMHLAEELTGRYSKSRRALPAICLCADSSAMTCIANDWDFSHVFSRQVEAFASQNDLLAIFSTSGNSPNCVQAAKAMKIAGGKVMGLLGKGGGEVRRLCDVALVVDSETTSHIQEAHQVALHLLLEAIDNEFA
jgi:D-sedoheptulose 7-phosphate isomerase